MTEPVVVAGKDRCTEKQHADRNDNGKRLPSLALHLFGKRDEERRRADADEYRKEVKRATVEIIPFPHFTAAEVQEDDEAERVDEEVHAVENPRLALPAKVRRDAEQSEGHRYRGRGGSQVEGPEPAIPEHPELIPEVSSRSARSGTRTTPSARIC